MSAAHDHEDLQRLLDRLSPEQARHLRVLAAADPQLHDLLDEPASSSDEGAQHERLLALAGIWDDGPLDAAERHDELIRERLAHES